MAKKTGLRFCSKAGAFQVLVRPKQDIYGGADRAVIVDTVPALTAEFGQWGSEYAYANILTGAMDTGADVRGHFLDLDIQAEEKGWSDEDVEIVATVLKRQCSLTPDMIWLHETPVPVAPWPTYDTTHHNTVPELAEQLGLVAEALAYEQQTKQRASVLTKLEEIAERESAAAELAAA